MQRHLNPLQQVMGRLDEFGNFDEILRALNPVHAGGRIDWMNILRDFQGYMEPTPDRQTQWSGQTWGVGNPNRWKGPWRDPRKPFRDMQKTLRVVKRIAQDMTASMSRVITATKKRKRFHRKPSNRSRFFVGKKRQRQSDFWVNRTPKKNHNKTFYG